MYDQVQAGIDVYMRQLQRARQRKLQVRIICRRQRASARGWRQRRDAAGQRRIIMDVKLEDVEEWIVDFCDSAVDI